MKKKIQLECTHCLVKDTHKEKAISNKTLPLTKSTNVGIWVIGTSNQFFIRFLNRIKIFKKLNSYWQSSLFCDRSVL